MNADAATKEPFVPAQEWPSYTAHELSDDGDSYLECTKHFLEYLQRCLHTCRNFKELSNELTDLCAERKAFLRQVEAAEKKRCAELAEAFKQKLEEYNID